MDTPSQYPMLCVLLLLLLLPQTNSTPNTIIKLLLETKHQLIEDDPGKNQLSDWGNSSSVDSPCNWTGITCNPSTSEPISINLNSLNLNATFPSSFCKIPTLQTLSLADNFLKGTLSSYDISPCSDLHFLNLSSNLFVGSLPEFTPVFPYLTVLDLSYNNFTGDIPPSFGKFPKLQKLKLFGNLLNGTIPSYLGYLPELTSLELADNCFTPSPLPSEIGNLHKLEFLWLRGANLVGKIPESIVQLVALKRIDVTINSLSGEIPRSIGRLKNLTEIIIFDNKLSGELPDSLGDLTNLRNFDASQNSLTGNLPEKLAGLQLFTLNLNDNHLQGQIPATLCLNKNLKELKLFNNKFSGNLPECLGVNSQLDHFDMSDNNFVGKFPAFLCDGKKLTRLIAFGNRFSGILSENYGVCDSLYYVRISNNALSGEVPVRLWSHPRISHLEISNNRFQGSVHPSIANARNLSKLFISGNSFSGVIPAGVCRLRLLAVLHASRNRFSGELPECITEMKNIQSLKLEQNMLSGNIPSNVGSWRALTELNLAGNRFSGEIPRALGNLPVLNYVDLSNNLLSGEIPHELLNLKLNKFNLSGNNLQGRIPAGFSRDMYVSSLIGNPNLCTEDLEPFRSCSNNRATARFVVAVVCGLLSVVLLSVLLFLVKKRTGIGSKRKLSWKLTSFHRLDFNEKDLRSLLTAENLIGYGGSGNVYRVKLKSGQIFAVKRLWVDNEKPENESVFNSEVETLGIIRHANIVKLLFSCVGEGYRILGYEYMENGSLGDVLHGDKGGILLDWNKRFNIAVGAANGLSYLHDDCVPPIVHRDVKSNNILLDEEFRPRIADFGLAKSFDDENDMSCVAGSYGYIAPEYAYTLKVTEKSDVYSFGVVLMELVTGLRPIDPSFGDDEDIVKWVTGAVSQDDEIGGRCLNLKRLMDARLSLSSCDYEEVEKVLNVALMCTSAFPLNRPSMRKVVELLKDRRATRIGTSLPK